MYRFRNEQLISGWTLRTEIHLVHCPLAAADPVCWADTMHLPFGQCSDHIGLGT